MAIPAGAMPASESFDKFNKQLQLMQKITKADAKKVVRNASRDFTRAALKSTPRAKANSQLWQKIIRKDGTVFWKKLKKGSPVGAGYAKSGWLAVMHSLGIKVKLKKKASKTYIKQLPFISVAQLTADSKVASFKKHTGSASSFGDAVKPGVMLVQKIPYITKLDREHRITNRAMSITVNKTEKILQRKMAKEMERSFRK